MNNKQRSRSVLHLFAIAGFVLGCQVKASVVAAPPSARTHADPCRSVGQRENEFRDWIGRIVTGAGPAADSLRKSWHLPALGDTSVTIATDSTTCAVGARAHARYVGSDTVDARPATVLRVGPSRFIVFNDWYIGKLGLVVVFDSTFQALTVLGM